MSEKVSERAFRFDDVTFRLSRFAELKSIHLNSFRLDSQVAHLLLDEFQDTSLDQWKVIQPLASQLTHPEDQRSFFFMGGKTSFFCVGDPKQAIYGWRGGRAEIFDALPEKLGELDEQNLVKSYRSSPVIIDFVNQVFQGMTRHKNLGRAEAAVTKFSESFPSHETERQELEGFVQIETGPFPQEGEKWSSINWKHAAKRIQQIHDATSDVTIGVLVRRNAAVAEIVGHIRKSGIPASEERGGNQLSDSAAVQILLSLIKIADHPGDTVARFHLATSPIAKQISLENHRDPQQAWELSQTIRAELSQSGYGPTLASYANLVIPFCNERQRRRIQQLVQLAYTYQENATLRPTNFVHFVESKRVPDPTNARIRVMTVHQSKGLEFDVVVLPDIDGKIVSQFKQCVFKRDSPSEPVSQISRHCRKEIRSLLTPDLISLFDQATLDDVTGELCLLYVALTRAVHALHLVVHPGRQATGNVSRLVTNAVVPEIEPDAEMEIFRMGNPDWETSQPDDSNLEQDQPAQKIQVPAAICFKQKSDTEITRSNRIRTPSDPLARDYVASASTAKFANLASPNDRNIRAADFLNLRNLESAARGTLFHLWVQQIGWLDGGLPKRESLIDAARNVTLGNLDLETELGNFETMLQAPNTRANLQAAAYSDPQRTPFSGKSWDQLEVKTEFEFVFPDERELVSGTIDRLILAKQRGAVVAADIIDFKTDVFDATDQEITATKIDSHRHQLVEYRNAIRGIFGLSDADISCRLFFVNYDLIGVVNNSSLSGYNS